MLIDHLRNTALYARLRDWRYLWRHRARRRFYSSCAARGSLVFDVGANVGHYTLIFRSVGARVVAVEPQAALAAQLEHRFARDRDGVRVENCALGATPGRAVLHKTSDLSEVASLRADVAELSRFAADHPYTETESVPVLTLDALISRHGQPDFCKIDVEGYEREVLSGLSTPLRLLSLEYNREYLDVAQDCLAALTRLGPYRYNCTVGDSVSYQFAEWCGASELREFWRTSTDPLLWGDFYARLPDQTV